MNPTRQVGTPTANHAGANQASDSRDARVLADLEDCLRKTLRFFRDMGENPEVPMKHRRVICNAVETVARRKPLSCPLEVMASIVTVGIFESGRDLRKLSVRCASQTELYKRVVLCYGFVTLQIPTAQRQVYLRRHILPKLRPFFTSKDLTVRAAVCFSVSIMAQAFGSAGVDIPRKAEMLNVMMKYIRDRPTVAASQFYCQQVLHACIHLSQVGPFYNEMQARLVQLCVGAVLSRPSEAVSEAYFEEVFSGDTYGLFALLTATLTQDVCLETLKEMLEPLQSACSSACNVAKVTAMTLVSAVLGIYRMMSVTRGSGLVPVAGLLASLIPRCWDTEPVVAQQAVTSIKMALEMWLYYEDGYIDDEKMGYIRQWIKEESLEWESCVALVQIVSECLRPRHRQTLVQGLLNGLQDPQASSARACCALLCQLLSSHPDELTELLPQVLHGFLGLSGAEESVRQSAKEGVLWLVFQDRALAIESLVSHPPPADHTVRYQQWCRELWGAIGASSLGPWTFRAIVEKLQSATRSQASVACAVQDVVAALSQEAVTFAEVFAALLPLLGVEDSGGDFAVQGFVVDSLKVLLSRAQLGEVALEQDWGLIREPGQQPEGIFRLTRALKTFAAPVLPEVVQLLWQRYSSADRGQKICITAFFAGLLRQPHPTDTCLLTEVRNLTLQMCEEPLEDVRLLAMQGLKSEPTEMHRYATEQLKLLSGALSQSDILSAVSSLGTILRFCEDGTAQRIIPRLYHMAKGCLENPDSEIRGATMLLLGQLVKAASVKRSLQKQCHGSLAMLLLHLQDPLPAVSQACQRALRQCAPALGCQTLTELIEGHLSQETLDFPSFARDVAAALQARLPSTMAVYRRCALRLSKSSIPHLRAGTSVFIGALLGSMDKTICSFWASRKLKTALSALLKDSDPWVQRRAAEVQAGFPQR